MSKAILPERLHQLRRVYDQTVAEADRLRRELGIPIQHARLEAALAQERRCRAAGMAMMTVKMKKLQAVADAAREASAQIQAQKTIWPIEVDHLADALAALDEETHHG